MGCLKERELVRGVECLILSGGSCLIAINDDLQVLASHLTDDSAHVNQDVSGVLSVDFLSEIGHRAKILAKVQFRRVSDNYHLPFGEV